MLPISAQKFQAKHQKELSTLAVAPSTIVCGLQEAHTKLMSDSIWKKPVEVEELNRLCVPTIHAALGIRFTSFGPNWLSAEMPVDERTKQPFGVLHGGASVVLAESLGSMASYLVLEESDRGALGIEVNANHVKAARSGLVTGTARPVHLGRSLHVWSIEVRDAGGDLLCTSRLTVLVREQKARPT